MLLYFKDDELFSTCKKISSQNFSEVSGQDHVVKAIQNSLKQNKAHHALLFSGTRGVGKTTIARLFAKSLNCLEGFRQSPAVNVKTAYQLMRETSWI